MIKIYTVVFSLFIGLLTINAQEVSTALKANNTYGFDSASKVEIYPIPANNFFNVKMSPKYLKGEIVIRDLVGKKVTSVIVEKETEKILIDQIPSGVYFVSLNYKGERIFTKRIVIDK